MSSIKDRIATYVKTKGISIRQFEASSGLSNGFVKNIVSGVGADKMRSIHRAFPDLNTDWLLTGEGEMLRAESVHVSPGTDVDRLADAVDRLARAVEVLTRKLS